jgi:hypothetical protein
MVKSFVNSNQAFYIFHSLLFQRDEMETVKVKTINHIENTIMLLTFSRTQAGSTLACFVQWFILPAWGFML